MEPTFIYPKVKKLFIWFIHYQSVDKINSCKFIYIYIKELYLVDHFILFSFLFISSHLFIGCFPKVNIPT